MGNSSLGRQFCSSLRSDPSQSTTLTVDNGNAEHPSAMEVDVVAAGVVPTLQVSGSEDQARDTLRSQWHCIARAIERKLEGLADD